MLHRRICRPNGKGSIKHSLPSCRITRDWNAKESIRGSIKLKKPMLPGNDARPGLLSSEPKQTDENENTWRHDGFKREGRCYDVGGARDHQTPSAALRQARCGRARRRAEEVGGECRIRRGGVWASDRGRRD